MLILGIETSAVSAGAAVVANGKLIGESYINTGLTHSQTVMCLIDTVLKNTGVTFDQIDAVAVAAGPGSFTGIRIGVSAVKGLCFPVNKPCYPVSTLEAMANCVDIEGYIICPVMDARCMQVYTARFVKSHGIIERLTDDKPMTLQELAEDLEKCSEKIMLIGDGTEIAYKFLSEKGLNVVKFSEVFSFQRASGVAIAAHRNYNRGESSVSADELQPIYLRLSQAEREKNKSGVNKNDSIKQ